MTAPAGIICFAVTFRTGAIAGAPEERLAANGTFITA